MMRSRLVLVLGLLVGLWGCESLAPREVAKTPPAPQPSGVDNYVVELGKLADSDAAKQSDVFYEIERTYTQTPTTTNTLRYALALTTPDHPGFDPVQGKKLLEQLLANRERLNNSEMAIANVMLNTADAWLKLQAENRRLAATVDERTRTQANSERRAQAQAEEIARLRKDLDTAQQKLDAIRDIERSIIERSATPSGNKPNRDSPVPSQSPAPGR